MRLEISILPLVVLHQAIGIPDRDEKTAYIQRKQHHRQVKLVVRLLLEPRRGNPDVKDESAKSKDAEEENL